MPCPWTHLLIYDGVCHLCDRSVQFVLRYDREGKFHFSALQSELGQTLYRQQGLDPEQPQSLLVLTPAGTFTHSDAVLEIARQLGLPWSLAHGLRWLPRALRDRAYAFIAARRYRWFGRSDQCLMPRPEWQSRFLTSTGTPGGGD